MLRFLTALLSCTGLLSTVLHAGEWTYVYPVGERDAFASAEFVLTLADDVQEPKGVIVLIEPQTKDGAQPSPGESWKSRISQPGYAVLECKFIDKVGRDFSQVNEGGRVALLQSLRELAQKSPKLRDLGQLHLLLIGRLAGAQFAYQFTTSESDRVAGFVALNPYYFSKPPTAGVRQTPAFLMATEDSHGQAAVAVRDFFGKQRRLGALWCLMVWNEKEKPSLSQDSLIRAFVEETLKARIKEDNPRGSLKPINLYKGWGLSVVDYLPESIVEARSIPRDREVSYGWVVSEKLASTVSSQMR